MLNMDWLHSFAVFADYLNFTRATAELHISQPALHAKVGKLSKEVGVPFYQRSGRRLKLTAEGKKVRDFAEEMRTRCLEFTNTLRSSGEKETVVLTAGKGSFLYLLGRGIRLLSRTSSATLQLLTADAPNSLAAVLAGKAHIGVSVLETMPEGIEATLLTDVPFAVAMPGNHPLTRGKLVHPEDLEGERLVLPPSGRPHRVVLERVLSQVANVAVEADGWEMMLHFVSLGLGLAVVNGACHLPSGLVTRPFPALPKIRYFLFHRNNWKATGQRQAFKQLLLQNGNEWRDKLPE